VTAADRGDVRRSRGGDLDAGLAGQLLKCVLQQRPRFGVANHGVLIRRGRDSMAPLFLDEEVFGFVEDIQRTLDMIQGSGFLPIGRSTESSMLLP